MKYSFFLFRRHHNTKNTIHQTLTQKAKHCDIALFQVNNPFPPSFYQQFWSTEDLCYVVCAYYAVLLSPAIRYGKVKKIITYSL